MVRLGLLLLSVASLSARNPFLPPENVSNLTLKVAGIVKCQGKYSGILECDSHVGVVSKGAKFREYFVNDIGSDFMVVSCNGTTKKLIIE